MKTTIPFTYLIGWTEHNLWYYGVRFAKGCNPNDLWTKYFTSSEVVASTRITLGEPDVVQVRKQFLTEVDAKNWEDKILSSIPKDKRQHWLNQTFSSFRGVVFTETIRKRIGEKSKGRECKTETRDKISKSMKGIKRSEETRLKNSESRNKVIAQHGNAGLASMHSEEVKQKVREKNRIRNKENPANKGRIWICNEFERKMIKPEDFESYKSKGWVKGYKSFGGVASLE